MRIVFGWKTSPFSPTTGMFSRKRRFHSSGPTEVGRASRETYDRGNGATILLYDPHRRTVILTRQFRYPAFVNGHDDLLIEAPAGLLDNAEPAVRIRAETEEETGFRVRDVRQVFDAFMSPGSVTERLHFSLENMSQEIAFHRAAARKTKAKILQCSKSISTRH